MKQRGDRMGHMFRKLVRMPEAVAHYSVGSVLMMARFVSFGIEARRAEPRAA